MEESPLISVVLATYNGSRFLEEQLISIYKQTYSNKEVIVCDDRSTDATLALLKAYEKRYGLKYFINEEKLGVVKNFEKAISLAQGEYIALSDQDDVWKPEKLDLSFRRLSTLEKELTGGAPALVFSDLVVVDEKLKCISPSYWKYMQLNPENCHLNRLVVENVATGCTVLMNKATARKALPFPDEALMHDIWLIMTASCFGKVGYLPEKTVLYRQHTANVVGARSNSFVQKLKIAYKKLIHNNAGLLQPEIRQAKAFYSRYQQSLETRPQEKLLLEKFVSLKESSFLTKKYLILKYDFFGSTIRKALNVLLRA